MSDQDETPRRRGRLGRRRPLAIPAELPILPLRDTVLFPNSFMPLAVARESSVRLIDEAIAGGKLIGVFTQRDASVEEPAQDDLYRVGTATHIHKMFKLPDGSLRLIVQGLARVCARSTSSRRGRICARAVDAPPTRRCATRIASRSTRCSATSRRNFQQVVSLSPLLSDDLQTLADEHHRARPARRLHRLEPGDASARRSSRKCSRRSTSARGWTRSTGS